MKNEFLYLSEISSLVGRLLPKRTPILLSEKVEKGGYRYVTLFQALRDRSFRSEHELAQELFQTSTQSSDYKTLRSNLKRRLLNTIFHLDLRNPLAKMEYKNTKLIFAAKILDKMGMRRYAAVIARTAWPIAQKYEFTVNEYECLHLLRYEAGFQGRHREYERLAERQLEVLRILKAEFEVSDYRDRLQMALTARHEIDKPSLQRAQDYVLEIREIYRRYPRFVIGGDYFRIQLQLHQMRGEYHKMLEVCDEADVFLLQYPHKVTKQPAEFLMRRLQCYAELHDIKRGLEAAKRCLPFYQDDDNWFIIKESEFLLHMYALDFEEARRIWEEVKTHRRLSAQPDHRKEKWILFQHYLLFALDEFAPQRTGRTAFVPSAAERRALSIYRETPAYSKDKAGYNVALIILQLLIFLDVKDYRSIVDRIESLKVYIRRYLRAERSEQSALFLQLILLLEKEDFVLRRIEEQAAPLLARLRSHEMSDRHMHGFKILPYDWLWQRITEKLPRSVAEQYR